MYTNTNPAELYNGTTWELITSDKYIRTGNTALQTGGSNSVSIAKANLPNVKLRVDSISLSTSAHTHNILANTVGGSDFNGNATSAKISYRGGNRHGTDRDDYWLSQSSSSPTLGQSSSASSSIPAFSPNTEILGSGTALNIQPAYITLKFWKRLT